MIAALKAKIPTWLFLPLAWISGLFFLQSPAAHKPGHGYGLRKLATQAPVQKGARAPVVTSTSPGHLSPPSHPRLVQPTLRTRVRQEKTARIHCRKSEVLSSAPRQRWCILLNKETPTWHGAPDIKLQSQLILLHRIWTQGLASGTAF